MLFTELAGQWRFLSGAYEKPVRLGLDYAAVVAFLHVRIPKRTIKKVFREIQLCELGAVMAFNGYELSKIHEL